MRLFLYEYSMAKRADFPLPQSVRDEGRAMFEALLSDACRLGLKPKILTIDASRSTGEEETKFRAMVTTADFAIIIAPEFDHLLEERCRWAIESGARLLGPSLPAIQIASDKWKLYQLWKDHAVPTPMTWPADQLPQHLGDYIRKHRFGAGSLEAERVRRPSILHPNQILQVWTPGRAVSQSVLIQQDQTVHFMPAGEQRFAKDNTFSYRGGVLPLKESDQVRMQRLTRAALCCIKDWCGYVGVDAVLGPAEDGSQDYVLEINPRLTTSYLGLRALSETNLLQGIIDCIENRVPRLSWRKSLVRFTAQGNIVHG